MNGFFKNFAASLLAGVMTFGVCRAIELKTFEQYGLPQTAEFRGQGVTASSQTIVVEGMLSSWSVYVASGTMDFTISYSSGIGKDGGSATGWSTITSSTIYVLGGQAVSSSMRGIMVNPSFNVTRIDAGATYYIELDYLMPRRGGMQ